MTAKYRSISIPVTLCPQKKFVSVTCRTVKERENLAYCPHSLVAPPSILSNIIFEVVYLKDPQYKSLTFLK